jgi:Ser/Thr protein kinase RdoA (MazF antagonist)
MFLREANVLQYLLARRFASLEGVVAGKYFVRDLSRRNRNFRVTCGSREYLVKQAKKWDYAGRSSLEQEAAFCRQARTDPRFEPLRRFTPEAYSYDPANSTLVFEFLPDDAPLATMPQRLLPETGRLVGRAMGQFHADMRRADLAPLFPLNPPSYLSMHRWQPEEASGASEGQRDLIRLVRRHREFAPALEMLEMDWRPHTMIHGDWKLDNCLLSAGAACLHVVDWELAGWGDPVWDVATLLQSWWCLWLRAPEENPLAEVQPVLREFLRSYAAAAGEDQNLLRRRTIAFAAARLLQSAWESLQKAAELEAFAVLAAQAGLNLLTRPEWGAAQLLGADA